MFEGFWRGSAYQIAKIPTQEYNETTLASEWSVMRSTGKRILAALFVVANLEPPQDAVEVSLDDRTRMTRC